MIPTPVPTTPDQSTLLFYVLLALIILTAGLSGWALYRTTQKTKSDAMGALSSALATSGGTIEDLLEMVGKRVETENEAIVLRGRVAVLEGVQQELQRQLVIKDGKLAELEKAQQDLKRAIEVKDTRLAESDRELGVLREQLQTARGEIAQLNQRNTEQSAEMATLREQLRLATVEIGELKRSQDQNDLRRNAETAR